MGDGTKGFDFKLFHKDVCYERADGGPHSCTLDLFIIRTAPSKHCGLDPLPTNIMKEHKDILAYFITRIVNTSLNTGHFSQKLKEAILQPLIKNIKLEPIFNNYPPVSNLSYLSKLIERLVCKQIARYTNSMGQMELYQSAYREHSSTETALLKIKADILETVEKRSNVLGDARLKLSL